MPPKRMTANPVRPARYRPGKPLPGEESNSSSSDDEDDDDEENKEAAERKQKSRKKEKKEEPTVTYVAQGAGQIITTSLQKVDLNQRFQKTSDDERSSDDDEEDEEDEAEQDDDGKSGKSRPTPSGDYESSSDSDDSSEEEESEEEQQPRKLIRPTFIPKSKRQVPAASTSTTTDTDKSLLETRKSETHALVESAIRKEAIEASAIRTKHLTADLTDNHHTEPPDDTDDLDPQSERAAWKLRELLRIKRARDAIEQIEKEREAIESRRAMDAEEKLKEDLEYVARQRAETQERRGKMGFLQKFYHKGAFYQDDDSELLRRDYATARVEDEVVNRELLPKALQIRSMDQLGKRGRTKWTHLSAEDTTNLGRDEGYGFGAAAMMKKKGKFEELKGVRDERFMSDKVRERREVERDSRRDDRRDDNYRPGGDYRDRRDGDRRRDRSRSPRRDNRRDYDSRRDGGRRRSDHDREDRRRDDDDGGGGGYKSRWDQGDRKRGGDEAHTDEKRRKIEA
ncbi:hypothetical protein AA313_de0208392 [Arthrobotrys entomopaga]|nr:hypothetical protein AA313_de0208392 [Arthrobotrys entomopaga]